MPADPGNADVFQIRASWTRRAVFQFLVGSVVTALVTWRVSVILPTISNPAVRVAITLPAVAGALGLVVALIAILRRRLLLEISPTGVTAWPPYYGRGRSLAWDEISKVTISTERVPINRRVILMVVSQTEDAAWKGRKRLSFPLQSAEDVAEQISRLGSVPVSITPDAAAPTDR